MKINALQVITDLDGKALPMSSQERKMLIAARDLVAQGRAADALPLLDQLVGESESLTFRKVAVNALLTTLQGDDGLTGVQKVEMHKLARTIHEQDELEILDEGKDVELLKERIGKAYGPVVVGPAFMILNGTPASTED